MTTSVTRATTSTTRLDELRIECAFAADEATAELCRRLADGR